MNARELRDKWADYSLLEAEGEELSTILRALDLLAGVEESADGIVRDLLDEADLCRNETATDIADLLEEAASCIVAMASQFKAKHAALFALEAENARLRGHAEAMAYISEEYWNRSANSRAMLDALDRLDAAAVAYRADFPKEKA